MAIATKEIIAIKQQDQIDWSVPVPGEAPIVTGIWKSPEEQARQMREQEEHVARMRRKNRIVEQVKIPYKEPDLPTF
jgi:hypothetical protein